MNALAIKIKCGHELTEKEKRAIHNPDDYPIMSVIKGIDEETKRNIYRELCNVPSISSKKYEHGQKKWLDDAGQYIWENKLNKDKKIDVQKSKFFIDEIINGSVRIEYRLYYTARKSREIRRMKASKELSGFLYDIFKVTGGRFGAKTDIAGKVI